MSIWVFIWLLLSAALLYFFGWTLWMTFNQKRTWKEYAARHKFRYEGGNMNAPPEMDGMVDDHHVSLFTGEHLLPDDERGRTRKMTAIEVRLNSHAPTAGGVASAGMIDFLKNLEFKHQVMPDYPGWSENFVAMAEDKAIMKAYLTTARLDALTKIMKIKNAWVILVFRDDVALLRFDTTKSLQDKKLLNKIVRALVEAAKVLDLEEGEEATLKLAQDTKDDKNAALDVKDEDLVTDLQLEDDDED